MSSMVIKSMTNETYGILTKLREFIYYHQEYSFQQKGENPGGYKIMKECQGCSVLCIMNKFKEL